ncbi:MAG: phosphotyrosine protein phosphatase [Rhodobacteraceae bacterium PARR1]|nr:MAG: phosphotyrosine protein phosphatase [Rhodobacteraceae bacterium PARR1]
MRIDSVLVVCVGNICRSPLGERALLARLPHLSVTSAGLGALEGAEADPDAARAAAELGISLDNHRARQWTADIGAAQDLILVMEPEQRSSIAKAHPELSGKTFLLSQWSGGNAINDPYKRSVEMHRAVAKEIIAAADAWAVRLKGRR